LEVSLGWVTDPAGTGDESGDSPVVAEASGIRPASPRKRAALTALALGAIVAVALQLGTSRVTALRPGTADRFVVGRIGLLGDEGRDRKSVSADMPPLAAPEPMKMPRGFW
jgi:hypothetical protein